MMIFSRSKPTMRVRHFHLSKSFPYAALGAIALSWAGTGWAQSNPSSAQNPYFGSVTAHPVTDGVMPLSLDDAVLRGLDANLGLKQAELAEKTVDGEKLIALQSFLPTITATGGTGVEQINLAALGFGPGVIGQFSPLFPNGKLPAGLQYITKVDLTQGQINLDQTLFSGPAINGYSAVRAAESAAHFERTKARGEVVQQVATAYLQAIADQAQVDNAKALLEADRVLLEEAHAKHEAGTAANLDELRARVQYQTQQQAVVASENAYEKQLILLKREIGIAPGQKIALTDTTPYSDIAERTPEEVRAEALENRQDYQSLQAQLREAQQIKLARKLERLPTLSFSGNYGVTGVTGGVYHDTFLAAGSLKFPIFKEGTLRGDLDVADAQRAGVDARLADLRGHIDQQVRVALMDVSATHKLVEVARSNVDLATKALSDESDRFAAGVDDTLPLVDAQAALAQAQANLVQSLYQYNLAKLTLARSAGVLEQQYKTYLGR